METTKVLVKEGNIAVITCPFCRKMRQVSVAQLRDKAKRELVIRCSCRNLFCTCLEFRKYPRKSVELMGRSINLSRPRERHDIIIKNISLGGLGFYPLEKHRILKDAGLQVSFGLKDYKNTFLETDVIVRAASPDYVSCEFKTMESYRPSLGFFLLG